MRKRLPVLFLFPLLFSNRTGKPVQKANTAWVLNVETWGGVMCFVAEIKPICTTQSDTEVIDFGWFQHKLDIFWHRPICGLFPSKCQSLLLVYDRLFTNHPGSIICETSSPLLLLLWVARTKLNSKKSLESFLSLPPIFGYLGKGTKNTAEHVILFTHGRA